MLKAPHHEAIARQWEILKRQYNAVNVLDSYEPIGIYSPLEVIEYGNS